MTRIRELGRTAPNFYFRIPSRSPKLVELGSEICYTGRHLQVLWLHVKFVKVKIWYTGRHLRVLGLHVEICHLRLWRLAASIFYFGNPFIFPKLIALGSWNLMFWLSFTDSRATCINFSARGVLSISNPTFLFLDSHISKTNQARKWNLVCWWMCRPVSSITRVAMTDQLTIANC